MSIGAQRSFSPPPRARGLYDDLADLIARHISRITVMSIMGNTLGHRSMTPSDINAENVVQFIEELMVGLRLFCEPTRLPDLMIELAEFCDRVLYASIAPPSMRSLMLAKPPPHS